MRYKNTKKNIINLIDLTIKHNQGKPTFTDILEMTLTHIKMCLEDEKYFDCVYKNALKKEKNDEID